MFVLPENVTPFNTIPHAYFMDRFGDVPRMLRPRVFAIDSPVFLPFTECLKTLASIPSLQVIDISQQSVIQLKVAVKDKVGGPTSLSSLGDSCVGGGYSSNFVNGWVDQIKKIQGCEVLLSYQYPPGVAPPSSDVEVTYVAVAVKVPYVMSFIRYCLKNRDALDVVQVFDFWG